MSTVISSGVESFGRRRIVGYEYREPPTAVHKELFVFTLKVFSPLYEEKIIKESSLISKDPELSSQTASLSAFVYHCTYRTA